MKSRIERLSALKYRGLLLLAAAIWGLGTVFIKGIVAEISPFWLASMRFFSAGVILSILFAPKLVKLVREKRMGEHMKVSLIVGIPMIAGYMANALGLVDTTAAKSSFLCGLYCVIVPFVSWILTRRRPTAFNMTAAVLCVGGVALVSLVGQSSLAMGWGDAVTLLSALFLAIQLALTSKVAPGRDMLAVTALSFVLGGGCGMAVAAATEPFPNLAVIAQPEMLGSIVYLVLFATCAALLLQNVGLAKVPAASGSLLLSFESVFGVLFSILLLGEALTIPMLTGFALIFLAVVVSEWLPTSGLARRVAAHMPEPIARRRAARPTHASQQVGTHTGQIPRARAHARYNRPASITTDETQG